MAASGPAAPPPPTPGFSPLLPGLRHSSRVTGLTLLPASRSCLSADEHVLRLWALPRGSSSSSSHGRGSAIQVQQCLAYPQGRPHYVSALAEVAVPQCQCGALVLMACLDGSLRVYTADSLRLRSAIPWRCGTVTCMAVNPANATLITAGSAGVKLWRSHEGAST